MWNNREENMNIRNQNLNINCVSRGIPFPQNMIFPPPNNYSRHFPPEESRKTIYTDNPGHSNVSSGFLESSQGDMGNMLHGNCNTQHNLSFTPANTNSQHENHQFYNMGSSSQTLQEKNESVNNLSCGSFPPFYHEESHFPHNQNFGSTEMFQVEPQLESTKNIAHRNNSKLCNPYLYPYPFKNIQSNAGSFEQNSSKNEIKGGKKMDQVTTLEPRIITLLVESPSKQTLSDNEGKELHVISQNDSNTQTNCGSFNNNQILYGKTISIEQTVQPKAQTPMHTEKVSNGVETKQLKQFEESNKDNMIKKSIEGNLFSNDNICPNKPIEPVGKLSPLLPEKLWDGSIQLSTSTTVSAIAFFKSGEKAQDLKWPEHLETKGKVRLQAFEKYIQELPRSRTRTLMLISLCWKPGSSEAGLAGMKEIAKAFKERERVGYAEISPGFDLYVCPRSETIITILAKHGFFKGMAVLEDDQDSLIGCVIWRRAKNTPSNSVPKIADKKFSPVTSVQESNSPGSQDDVLESKQKKTESTSLQETSKLAEFPKPVQEIKQEINSFHSPINFSYDHSSFAYVGAHAPTQEASIVSHQEISMEAEFPKPVQEQKQKIESFYGARNFSYDSSSFTYVGAHAPSQETSIAIKADSTSLQETSKEPEFPKPVQGKKQESNNFHSPRNFSYDSSSFTYVGAHALTQVQPSILGRPPMNQSKGGLIKAPPVESKKLEPAPKVENDDDDDDLPEFDFNHAIGITKSPTTKTVQPLSNQQPSTNKVKSEYTPISSPTKKLIHNRDPNPSPNSRILKKSRWDEDDDDDDDNMPEWCPPVMENTTQTHSNDFKSELANSSSKDKIQSISYGCQSKLEQNQTMRPPLENAREMGLMPNDPRFRNQSFAPPGARKPPASGFVVNDFRPPVPNSGNRMRPPAPDFSRRWRRR